MRTERVITASANLLGEVLNNFINAEYAKKKNVVIYEKLAKGVDTTHELPGHPAELLLVRLGRQNLAADDGTYLLSFHFKGNAKIWGERAIITVRDVKRKLWCRLEDGG